MDRTILHVDMNSFYASVEALHQPALRGRPLAVGGNVEARHGIILAKTPEAKRFGVRTGEALWEARQKCPGLVIVPPNYPLYLRYSDLARQIYLRYTQQVEPFGLDECWLDVTGRPGPATADEIRGLIRRELGVTASIGVSWNRVFAKLGSDMRKPDATTIITRANMTDLVWPLPVSELLYVGPATTRKLRAIGVHTIGQLAALDPLTLRRRFGVVGLMLGAYARGEDTSPVAEDGHKNPVKSVGNSVTTARDLVSDTDARLTLYALAESVGARLREHGLQAHVVEVSVRDNGLYSFTRQTRLVRPSHLTGEISDAALALFRANYAWPAPIRSLGLRCSDLSPDRPCQLSWLPEEIRRQRLDRLDHVVDALRRRYGYHMVRKAILLTDPLGDLDARHDHVIAPISWF